MTVLKSEIECWQRYQTPLSVMVLDVDFFKQVNDNYGHEAGDQVLKIISTQMEELTRNSDTVSRWGGDEFVVILPHTILKDACLLAERIRDAILHNPLIYQEEQVNFTVSIGVAVMNDDLSNGDELIVKADLCLFKGKEAGRNNVSI
jgi:diguanylate cyclase (GGDEF)-like protein